MFALDQLTQLYKGIYNKQRYDATPKHANVCSPCLIWNLIQNTGNKLSSGTCFQIWVQVSEPKLISLV